MCQKLGRKTGRCRQSVSPCANRGQYRQQRNNLFIYLLEAVSDSASRARGCQESVQRTKACVRRLVPIIQRTGGRDMSCVQSMFQDGESLTSISTYRDRAAYRDGGVVEMFHN